MTAPPSTLRSGLDPHPAEPDQFQRKDRHAEIGNAASRRVAEKAGFLVEATLRQRHVRRGQRVDIWAGSLLKGEYRF